MARRTFRVWRHVGALVVVAVASSCTGVGSPPPAAVVQAPICDDSTADGDLPSESPASFDFDVRFSPGDPVAELVSGSPDGAVFVFSSGRYEGVSIEPRHGQTFFGEPGAVLDGMDADFAFRSAASGVTITGLEITGYEPVPKDGVIHGEPGARGWVVEDNHVHNNSEVGIDGVRDWRILSNRVHHNGRYGITASGADVVVEDNEIFCNANEVGATGDSGGTKFVHTVDLVLRGNSVHDNYGNGLWIDINNVDAIVEGNELLRNERSGIHLEISCGGIIRSNRLEGNGFGDRNENWMSGSAINVALTPDVTVYDNTLVGNAMGIGGIQWNHGNVDAVTMCVPQLRNLDVHDNTIDQSGGAAAGLDAGNFRAEVWSQWGNGFRNNTFMLSDGAGFRWEGRWVSWEEWVSDGLG